MDKNNSALDKFSFYFFMGTLVIGILMSLVFLIKANLEVDKATVNTTDTAVVVPVVTEAPMKFNYYTTITDTTTLALLTPRFEGLTIIQNVDTYTSMSQESNAVFISNTEVPALESSEDYTSFETTINESKAIIYINKDLKPGFAKAPSLNIQERVKGGKIAKQQVG